MIESQPRPAEEDGRDSVAVADRADDKKAAKAAKKEAKREAKSVERIFEGRQDADKIMIKWIRAAMSLVATGVAIERVVWHVQYSGLNRIDPYSVLRGVGIGLAVLGVAALGIACAQHQQTLKRLDLGEPPPLFRIPLSLVVGVVLAALSVAALAGVFVAFG
jgi:uncharacterized membrane protein YidH (DUF202 family)